VTPQQAAAYAEKILAALAGAEIRADLHLLLMRQVHSALRAVHRAEEGLEDALNCDCECYRQENHARRHAEARDDALDDLRRAGRLYGISETNAPGNPERTSGAIGERAPSGRPDTTRRAQQPADVAERTAHEQDRPFSAPRGHSDGRTAPAGYSATPDSAERRTEPEEKR
jgi:hypothetical protein